MQITKEVLLKIFKEEDLTKLPLTYLLMSEATYLDYKPTSPIKVPRYDGITFPYHSYYKYISRMVHYEDI